MKPETKIKLKVRVAQAGVIIATGILTKVAIHYAFIERGYKAIGGEYLIPIIGLLVVVIIEDAYKKSEKRRKQKRGKSKSKNK